MESDIKLKDGGTVEITGDKVKADVGFGGGAIELNGSNFKTSVTDVEMLYYGGHLTAKGGNVELGSSDSGTFKGFGQLKDGTIQITGDKLEAAVGRAQIGSRSSGKFKGLMLRDSGVVGCYAYSFTVLNPDVQNDSKLRTALAQSACDELLINVKGHYQGGVKLDGPVHLSGDVSVQTTLQMKVGSKLLLLMPDKIAISPDGKTKIRLPGQPINLLETIQKLQGMVKQLQDKVAALEAR